MARTSKNPKKQKKTKLQTTCPQSQTRAPMRSAVLFLFFVVFRGFCMVCSRWPENRKQKNQNCRPHVHRVKQEPQWGLQFFLFFCFSRFLHGLLQMAKTSKNKTKKLQTTCPQSQTRAPMGSAGFFCFFEVFAWFAPDGQQQERLLVYTVIFSISAADRRL